MNPALFNPAGRFTAMLMSLCVVWSCRVDVSKLRVNGDAAETNGVDAMPMVDARADAVDAGIGLDTPSPLDSGTGDRGEMDAKPSGGGLDADSQRETGDPLEVGTLDAQPDLPATVPDAQPVDLSLAFDAQVPVDVAMPADLAVGPDPALRAFYSFEEGSGTTVGDQSGYGNNGTTLGTFITGKVGGGMRTSGVNNVVTVPHSSSLAFSGSEFTLEGWVRPAAVTSGSSNWRWVVQKFVTTPGGYGLFVAGNPATQVCMSTYNLPQFCANASIPNGTWAHVAAVSVGTTWRLYLNGTQVGSQSGHGANLVLGTSPVSIGLSAFMDLDEVQIWSRARTAAEICVDAGKTWTMGTCSDLRGPA